MGMMKKASGNAVNKKDPPQSTSESAGDEGQPQGSPAGDDAESGPVSQSAADNGQQDPTGGDQQGSDEDSDEGQESSQGGSPDDGDADDSSAQDTGQPGSPADDTGGGPAAGENLNEVPAKPQQQAEYNKANQMLYQTLYQNTGAGNAVVKGLQQARKVDSAVRLCTMLVDQIDKKINMDQAIILPFTKDVVAHVIDVAEQVKGMQFSDDEANAVLGATLQAVMHIFGVTKQQAQKFMEHMSPEDQQNALSTYHSTLAKSKAAVQQGQQAGNAQQPQAQQGAQQQGQGAAPQGGAQQPAQGGGDDNSDAEGSQGDNEGSGGNAEPAQQQTGGMMSQAQQGEEQ